MSIADSDDVEAALGRTLTSSEQEQVDGLLAIASAYVKDQTGFYFEPGTYTIGRKPHGMKVRIPAAVSSVGSVTAVDQCDGSATTLTVNVDYTRRAALLYGLRHDWVEVAFTVTADPPDDIVSLVAGMVATTIESPGANVSSEAAGPFSRSFITTSGRVYLSASDKAVLRRFKQPKPAIELSTRVS